MPLVFDRGWGPYQSGHVYDLPEPLAQVHIALGRARKVKAAEPKGAEPPKVERAPTRRR